MEYAHRNTLVQVDRADCDGFIETQVGIQPVSKGDLIATNEYGNKFVVDDIYFNDNYIMVKKLRTPKTVRKSPFELAYEQQLQEFSLLNQEEDQQYINRTKELHDINYTNNK